MGHIFISYSHKDSDYVHRLQETLQKEGFDAWIDDRIDYGDEWLKVIQKHLDECDAFLIVLSNNSFESDMVQNEVTRAREKRKPIFPLLFDGDNWLIVQAKQFVDVRDGSLPTEKFYRQLEEVTPRKHERAEPDDAEKAKRERVGDQATQTASPKGTVSESFTAIKSILPKAVPFLRIASFAGIAIALLEIGLWAVPKFLLISPTQKTTATQRLTAQISYTNSPVSTKKTLAPSATPKPFGPTVTPMPSEITDTKGVSMVLVPEGEFIMGSDTGEPDEKPAHKVFLPNYYIDKYEVTNALYKACVAVGECIQPTKKNLENIPRYYESDTYNNYPVVHVTWYMALSYCEWRGASLPTEAEWEKSARGPNGIMFPWGNEFDGLKTNSCDFSCDSPKRNTDFNDGYMYTSPVGNYPDGKSLYGALDLAGNVWEWVAGEYRDYYAFSLQNFYLVNLPYATEAPVEKTKYIARGGSWFNTEDLIRSSYRAEFNVDDSIASIGFRCAKNANP